MFLGQSCGQSKDQNVGIMDLQDKYLLSCCVLVVWVECPGLQLSLLSGHHYMTLQGHQDNLKVICKKSLNTSLFTISQNMGLLLCRPHRPRIIGRNKTRRDLHVSSRPPPCQPHHCTGQTPFMCNCNPTLKIAVISEQIMKFSYCFEF